MEQNVRELILEKKLIAIARGVQKEELLRLAEALYEGGIRLMELPFDQSGRCTDEETAEKIHLLSEKMEGRMVIGSGTVLTQKQVQLSRDAGAKYIISPDTNPEIIRETKRLQLLSMPGALTPSEVQCAYAAGADFVKIFPAGCMGVEYIRAISAPLCQIPLFAVGGVDEKNLTAFLDAGVCGFGIGSNLIRKDWIAAGRFQELTAYAKEYTNQIEEWNYVHRH